MTWPIRRVGSLAVCACAVLVACELQPGKASLTFTGSLSGEVDGPTVTCPALGDASATWVWSGSVAGRKASVTAAALNNTGTPDALLINVDNTSWAAAGQPAGSAPAIGKFTASVGKGKVLTIDGIVTPMSAPGSAQIEIHGAMRCPN